MSLAPDDPRHGSRRGYDLGCRCFPCALADSRYMREWLDHGPTRIPAVDVIAHIRTLVDSGWTKSAIIADLGLGKTTIWHIENRQSTVNRGTAERIFSLEPFRKVTLDVAPLARLVARSDRTIRPTLTDSQARGWYRAVERGRIGDELADLVAVRMLSLTLEEVYGHDWDEVAA